MSRAHINFGGYRRALSAAQLRDFRRFGFVVVRNVFSRHELDPLIQRVSRWIDVVARDLYAARKLSSLYSDLPFDRRMAAIEREVPGVAARMHIAKVKDKGHGLSAGHISREWVESRNIWGSEKMLDLVEQCLQTRDIAAHPVFNLRLRVPTSTNYTGKADNPENTSQYDVFHTVPFHQDAAYNLPEADNTLQVGAWIPLVDVSKTKMNGPMEFVKWEQKEMKILSHKNANNGSWYLVCDEPEFKSKIAGNKVETVIVDVNVGDIILFNNWVPHRSLPNYVNSSARISFDMRWQSIHEPHGTFGGKLVQLRSNDDRNFKIDWSKYLPRTANVQGPREGKYVGRWGELKPMTHLEEIFYRTTALSKSVPIVGGEKREEELEYFKLLKEGKIDENGKPIL